MARWLTSAWPGVVDGPSCAIQASRCCRKPSQSATPVESGGSSLLVQPASASISTSARTLRRGLRRLEAGHVEQRAIGVDVGVAGGEQLLAVEDGVRAGEEAQHL